MGESCKDALRLSLAVLSDRTIVVADWLRLDIQIELSCSRPQLGVKTGSDLIVDEQMATRPERALRFVKYAPDKCTALT